MLSSSFGIVDRIDDSALGFPDPFAVATIGGEQTRTTSVIKKTLNPYWNESFDMWEGLADRLNYRKD